MKLLLVAVTAAAMALPSAAVAADAPPAAVAAASFIAGKPVTVACDAETTRPLGVASEASGWAVVGGSTIHLASYVCSYLDPKFGPRFAPAIGGLIHEAAHARGYRPEACAELIADVGVYDVLRRFYAMPFWSLESRRIGDALVAYTQRQPLAYQPYLSACEG